jgi:hypothetical protein
MNAGGSTPSRPHISSTTVDHASVRHLWTLLAQVLDLRFDVVAEFAVFTDPGCRITQTGLHEPESRLDKFRPRGRTSRRSLREVEGSGCQETAEAQPLLPPARQPVQCGDGGVTRWIV